jgi:hypothetical protein
MLLMLAIGAVACDPGPTPELRARSASDSPQSLRYAMPRDTSAPPASPPDEPPASRKNDKFEKH